MRRRKNKLMPIAREAKAAGLSYGQYVASGRAKRSKIPANYLSVNDRKRLGIETPIYCGKTTIEAALPLDCPRRTELIIGAAVERAKERQKQEAERSFTDEVIFMYLSGCKLSQIQSELQQPRSVIVGILRSANIGLRGKSPLPKETIVKTEENRAEGLSYEEIAKECGVTEKTVKNYLCGEETKI